MTSRGEPLVSGTLPHWKGQVDECFLLRRISCGPLRALYFFRPFNFGVSDKLQKTYWVCHVRIEPEMKAWMGFTVSTSSAIPARKDFTRDCTEKVTMGYSKLKELCSRVVQVTT